MGIAIVLTFVALLLFVAVQRGWINKDTTLATLANIGSIAYHSRKFFGKFVGGELRPTPIYGGTTYYEFDELSTELMLQGHF